MSATTKSSTQLLGTGGAAATVSHGGTPVHSAPLAMGTDFDGALACRVTIPASPGTVNPTVQPQWSPDGAVFFDDGGPYVIPLTASTSFDVPPYIPPAAAKAARWVVTNADGSVDVTALAYGSSLDTVG